MSRNPIAHAHSLRGPAGSGPHRSPGRRAIETTCEDCGADLLRSGLCPRCEVEQPGRDEEDGA